ncbi:hypothetical protein P4J26_31175, partial [Bacillus cereus]|nr:hypothetical protein [Bacillus cereus]
MKVDFNPSKFENNELQKDSYEKVFETVFHTLNAVLKSTDKNEYYYRLIAMWNKDLMKFEQEYQELTESEKQEYNGHLIDEMEVE